MMRLLEIDSIAGNLSSQKNVAAQGFDGVSRLSRTVGNRQTLTKSLSVFFRHVLSPGSVVYLFYENNKS